MISAPTGSACLPIAPFMRTSSVFSTELTAATALLVTDAYPSVFSTCLPHFGNRAQLQLGNLPKARYDFAQEDALRASRKYFRTRLRLTRRSDQSGRVAEAVLAD